jgi:hypothetical protein
MFLQNKLAQVVTSVGCIREVLGSNLGPYIDYPEWSFRCFPQSLREDAGIVPQIRPLPIPFTSFPIYYSLVVLSISAV